MVGIKMNSLGGMRLDYVTKLRKMVGHTPLILIGSIVWILNEQNEILLQYRQDGDWRIPGGLMEPGETLADTARREVKEETGLVVGELKLLDIFSGPEYYIELANQDAFYSVTTVYVSRDVHGELHADGDESVELRYFSLHQLPSNLNKEYQSYIDPFIKELEKGLI